MPPDEPDISRFEPRFAAITAGVFALIVYGSLYPFQYYPGPSSASPLRFLLSTWRGYFDRGDCLSNVLLYMPLGLFATRSLRAIRPFARILIVTLVGLTLSVSIELSQFHDLTRAPELRDVYANFGGVVLGSFAAVFIRRELFPGISWRPFAMLLVLIWLGGALYPYVPSFGAHEYALLKAAFVPLRLPRLEVCKQIVFWLSAATLLEALFGAARSRVALAVLVPVVLLARLATALLSPADVAGILLAAVLWIGLSRLPNPAAGVAALFLIFVVLQALQPFRFALPARHFGWAPFLAFINGPRESGSRVFLEKSFTYGALVWLLIRAGMSWTAATVSTAILEFGLRFAQVYLPGRSAEITDAVMVLMLAGVMKLIHEPGTGYIDSIN